MAIAVVPLMQQASKLLNDTSQVRWPLQELADWINEGVRAIVLARPAASSQSRVLSLAVGTLQRLPTTPAPVPIALLNVTRNLATSADNPRVGARIIRPTSRAILDVQEPYWHDTAVVPYRKEVRQWLQDEINPLEFYVYPGNDGTGFVEAVMSVTPALVVATGDPLIITSWAQNIALPDPYSVPLLDYVLYRCQMKDDTGAQNGRAAAHYQQFANAMGIKAQVDASIAMGQKAS